MRSRLPLLLTLVAVSLATAAGAAQSASATVLPTLKTYKVAVDVDLRFFEKVTWKGIVPGCFNPAEDFVLPYYVEMQSTPRKGQKPKPGTATVTSNLVGVTPSYGAPGGFRQESRGATWTLQTKNPAPCDSSPVPDYASSPTCKKVSERVSAHLQMESDNSDGRLVISRTPKAKPGLRGRKIGESCLRALVDPVSRQLATEVAISEGNTFVTVPIRSLRSKLVALTGEKTTKFTLPITIGGDCMGLTMSGSIGNDPDWSDSDLGKSEFWLGPGPGTKATCSLGGSGSVTVERVGKVQDTSFKIPKGIL